MKISSSKLTPSHLIFCFPGGSDSKESACNPGDSGLIRESGRSLGEGNGNPLHYSCLENPMDRGAWWATVHSIAKSQTWLSQVTFFFHPIFDPKGNCYWIISCNSPMTQKRIHIHMYKCSRVFLCFSFLTYWIGIILFTSLYFFFNLLPNIENHSTYIFTSFRHQYLQATPVFLPGRFHRQRTLVGYSPWGCKESNMTEWTCTHICIYGLIDWWIWRLGRS